MQNNPTSFHSENASVESNVITITDTPSLIVQSHTHTSKRRKCTGLITLFFVAIILVRIVALTRQRSTGSYYYVHIQKSDKEILWDNLDFNIKYFMDKKFDPCENFYEYACGGWNELYQSALNDTLSALEVLTVKNYETLQNVFERKNTAKISQSERKARDFYLSCINQDTDESLVNNAFPNSVNISDFDNYTNIDEYFGQFRLSNLSNKFIHRILNLEETSVDEAKNLARKCFFETTSYFPDVSGLMFVNEVMPSGQDPNVYDIFNDLKKSYIDIAKTFVKENFKKKNLILKKLSNVPLWNGYHQSFFDDLDKSYRSINISTNTYILNKLHLNLTSKKKSELSDIVKASAFYVAVFDAVVLNAGIIQKPIYDINFPNVINYAGLGFTLGHELSHAFYYYYYKCEDCLYGENDPRVCLEDFYSHLAIDEKFVNGSLTLEENFSDIFGLHVAYTAYKNSKMEETLPGFTHKQLFFIALTQNFCQTKGSKENEKQFIEEQLQNDTHSPRSVRILGMYSHSKEFAQAFNCPVGSAYNPVKKCNIF